MMFKNEIILVALILLVVLLAVNQSRKGKEISQVYDPPLNCEVIGRADTVYSLPDPMILCCKVVVLIDERVLTVLKDWKEYILNYNNVPFFFYVKTTNKEYVQKFLEDHKFPIPVLHIENIDENFLFISYILNAENKIICLSNPSIPDFKQKLKLISKTNKESE